MAATLMPRASNFCFAFCSWTSCALQKGHQSAERKKSRTVPFAPFNVSMDWSWPNWSRSAKAGAFCPTCNPTAGATGGLLDGSSCARPRLKNPKTNTTARTNRILPLNSKLEATVLKSWLMPGPGTVDASSKAEPIPLPKLFLRSVLE